MIAAPTEVGISLMGLDESHYALIRQACTNATGTIKISELDKGLSGARVLLASWPLQANTESALHVLKIGPYDKLEWEMKQAEDIVAPVDPNVGHMKLYQSEDLARGLLRQAFIGSSDGNIQSLKEWIRGLPTPECTANKIDELFEKRMRQWHCTEDNNPPLKQIKYDKVLEGRVDRITDLYKVFDDVGREALTQSFQDLGYPSIPEIETKIAEIRKVQEVFPVGLVHGDLHAQNILVDTNEELHLIDFAWAQYGWKALDFLMLECSLKLLVVPNECRIEDLIHMEAIVESGDGADCYFENLEGRPFSRDLRVFACALHAVRKQAMKWEAVNDFEQYRRGLIVLMACLGTYPDLNRNFLAHSLAYHVHHCV